MWGPPFKPWNIGLLFVWYLWFGNMERCIKWIERWVKYNKGLWQWNVLETLWMFYDHLNKKHQNIFLDIACFFVSFKKSIFCRMYWNGDDSSSPMLILQNLKARFLIKWIEDDDLYPAWTIVRHGIKYCNKSYNESIYMETKYIFVKDSSLRTMC